MWDISEYHVGKVSRTPFSRSASLVTDPTSTIEPPRLRSWRPHYSPVRELKFITIADEWYLALSRYLALTLNRYILSGGADKCVQLHDFEGKRIGQFGEALWDLHAGDGELETVSELPAAEIPISSASSLPDIRPSSAQRPGTSGSMISIIEDDGTSEDIFVRPAPV